MLGKVRDVKAYQVWVRYVEACWLGVRSMLGKGEARCVDKMKPG